MREPQVGLISAQDTLYIFLSNSKPNSNRKSRAIRLLMAGQLLYSSKSDQEWSCRTKKGILFTLP